MNFEDILADNDCIVEVQMVAMPKQSEDTITADCTFNGVNISYIRPTYSYYKAVDELQALEIMGVCER